MQAAGRAGYRADIQGLRAIAVLGVVLFHIDPAWMPGGFVGVDVFFVISGFLISGILLRGLRAGTFSFTDFYLRRAKRILPAFALVCLCTLAAGWWLLLPTSLVALVKSAIASSLFASNVFFWRATTGYFGSDSRELPLLHNWSLSVEEQFYMLWPLALLLLLRVVKERQLAWLIAAAAIASFALAQWGAVNMPTAAYFLLPTRAGEFLIGALLAVLPARSWLSRPALPTVAAIAGLLLLVGSNILLDERMTFPGWNALLPCLGTALLIEAGRGTGNPISTALGLKPLVFIGTISYSLYLWHWPPIAFLHYFDIELATLQKLCLLVVLVAVGWASWRWIEEPLRHLQWRLPKTAMAFAIAPLAVMAGLLLQVDEQKPTFRGLGEIVAVPGNCPEGVGGNDYPKHCRLGDIEREPTFALWGDSYAGTLSPAMHQKGRETHTSGYLFAISMCPSIVDVVWKDRHAFPTPDFDQVCARYNDGVFDFILHSPQLRTVVLTSNYFWYQTGRSSDGKPLVESTHSGRTLVSEYQAMIEKLIDAGKHVVVVMPHPSDKSAFNRSLRQAYVADDLRGLRISRGETGPDGITAMIERLATHVSIDRVYPDRLMCDRRDCRLFDDDGELFLSDGAHLTPKTADVVVHEFPGDWDAPAPPLHLVGKSHPRHVAAP